MAGIAFFAKGTLMGIPGGVTGITVLCCFGETSQGVHTDMTFIARHVFMSALQFEGKPGVIEGLAEMVHPVMTIHAGRPVGFGVGCRKAGVNLSVAAAACVGLEGGDVSLMAVGACEGFLLHRQLVRFQGEAHHLMRDRMSAQFRQGAGRSAVFGVAIAAGQPGVLIRDRAMQGRHIQQLGGDPGMAIRTTLRH